MKLPAIALCTMLTAFAFPASADTAHVRTAEFNGVSGRATTLLHNGESTEAQLVKRQYRYRHSHYGYRSPRHRHYRPYYYRPHYYYEPYYYSYPRGGFYFRF